MAEVVFERMPITEAVVAVPAPSFVVRFLIVLEVKMAAALSVVKPSIREAVPVEIVSWMELATVPPILLDAALKTFEVEVFTLIPYNKIAETPAFVTEMPPMLLLLAVQSSTPKLYIPCTSVMELVVVENVNEPVAL